MISGFLYLKTNNYLADDQQVPNVSFFAFYQT